ncbi:MAG: glutathione synthase [Methylicorpusculum sp.]|uniref:glutathione synthase n=2 Tax=Methylicorpusculum sp. TaxID=2713644 RepID=UPI0027176D65|nr:glutathione synthase [Methylicorpusculum sp.]MDO8843903.1 glutathione synthase [Methylicorpusculum sp.]MDO8939373.1 glutathione synthase [Methylicorpusculum sp.]MDO9240432.1 glutathione synthase [Methylicorpusculum sp.]MDP2178557.1 glutathione synthase [Methylicorpusculum sp.]MDP2203364.1 glutathione synthase [Methylicorpusculum sp.]
MAIKLGMVMDPIAKINIKKDTSFAMLLEAQHRGWELHYMELNDLYLRNGRAFARTRTLSVERNELQWFRFGGEQNLALDELDVIIMRKDPPFDQEYIYATYLLERAEANGTYVVNKPQSLRDANEKLFTAWFPDCCPDTLVARDSNKIREFLNEHGEIILKPLDGMGGTSIFYVHQNDPNLSVILETMTHYNGRYVMAQKYLPEIKNGDKRILIVNGEVVPYALARIPAQGESRGNLAAGGSSEGRIITERDMWIANQIGPTLKEKGLVFVGIDVIGDYLTEINVTSPTCVQELDRAFGLNIAGQLMDHIEEKLQAL